MNMCILVLPQTVWEQKTAFGVGVGKGISRSQARPNRCLLTVGIELVRARFRWRVTAPALSLARRVHNSTIATFHEAPL
jgi:hypothetical protein